jgi:hypothetical protein
MSINEQKYDFNVGDSVIVTNLNQTAKNGELVKYKVGDVGIISTVATRLATVIFGTVSYLVYNSEIEHSKIVSNDVPPPPTPTSVVADTTLQTNLAEKQLKSILTLTRDQVTLYALADVSRAVGGLISKGVTLDNFIDFLTLHRDNFERRV